MTATNTTKDYTELCPIDGGIIDPESHTLNPKTGDKYCSPECWAEDNMGDH